LATVTRAEAHRRTGNSAGEARRSRILHAALLEFAENGYRGSALAAIAARAELTQTGLLHHFPSKQHLLIAVLELRDSLDAARFGLLEDSDQSGTERLRALVALVEHNARVPGLVQLFTVISAESVTPGHPAQSWTVDRYRRLRADLAGGLRQAAASGEFRSDLDADAVAERVFAMMDGLQLQWLLDPDRVDMPGLFHDFIEDLLDHLRSADRP
jgi:AcrR family transcriptional regulator